MGEKGERDSYWLESRSQGQAGETAREARSKGDAIGVYPGGEGRGRVRSAMLQWEKVLVGCWGLGHQRGNGKSKTIEEGVKGTIREC